ncbi:MAG: hypothetical protein GX364_05660 [Firmicutes bacterium]|jgi:hypothetical protein|nr:hypothetical protein [Bacillota bacterium]
MSRFKNLMMISLVALLVLCFSGVSEVVFAVDGDDATETYFGDVNADDDINVSDAIAVLRHIVSLAPFDKEELKDNEAWQRADVNLDGDVDVSDAIMILRYIVGLIKEFGPAGSTATVHTETAFLHALDFDHVKTVKLGRDITPAKNLEIERNLTLDGDDHALRGEVVVGSEVTSFTAENIEIDTLTLNGGGTDSVNLMGAVINILNVNVDVSIEIDKDSTITQIWVAKGAAPSFGGEGLPDDIDIYYVVTFVVKDSRDNTPVPGAEIDVRIFVDGEAEEVTTLTTDNNGVAEDHFVEGQYDYFVTPPVDKNLRDKKAPFQVIGEEKVVEVDLQPAFGDPEYLEIIVHPSETVAGEAIDPAPAVQVCDEFGNSVEEAGIEVTVTLDGGDFASGSDTETTVTDTNGKAEFNDLVIEKADTGYELTFSAEDLDDAVSEPFDVIAAGIDGDESSVELISDETVEAGEDNIELLLALKDEYDNPISGTFHVVIGGSMPFWEEDVEFSADGEATVFSEWLYTCTAYFPVEVGGIGIGGFDVTVVAAAPASFALDVDFDDAEDLTFAFTGFKDRFGNRIDDPDIDPEESNITLVANDESLDISVSLADLPDFAVDGGTMTVTVEAGDILSLAGGAGYFDGLDLNVHTTVDTELSGDGWEIMLSDIADLPEFPVEDLNDFFVAMVDDDLLPLEDAMDNDINLLQLYWDGQPRNFYNACAAYDAANGIYEVLERVVLEDTLETQREYLEWVGDSLQAVEGMLAQEYRIIEARKAVMPHEGGEVTPVTISAARDEIAAFEDAYGDLQINAATDEHRDGIINDTKEQVSFQMNVSFGVIGASGVEPGGFHIEAPWLDDTGDKVDHFNISNFHPFHVLSGDPPDDVNLEWDGDEEAYYLRALFDEGTPGTGRIEVWLQAAGAADELARYFEVDREIQLQGSYDPSGKITMGPLPLEKCPVDGARNVRVDSEIKVTYDMRINFVTDGSGIMMEYFDPVTDNWEPMTVTGLINNEVLFIEPHEGLDFGTDYRVLIPYGTVESAETELPSTQEVSWGFSTEMAMDIDPLEIYVRSFEDGGPGDVEFNQTFTLTLNCGDFNEELSESDFALGGIFAEWGDASLDIASAERDQEDANLARVTVEGYLNIRPEEWGGFDWDDDGHYATGTIIALASGHDYDDGDVSAAVALREELDPIWINPGHLHVPVYDESGPDVAINEQFRVGLGFGTFVENLDESDFALGGIFADGEGYAALQVENVKIDIVNPSVASFTLTGTLNISEEQWHQFWDQWHQDPVGTITLLASGHSGDEDLIASVWVSQPPDPLRAHPDRIFVPVYDGENDVSIDETFELELGDGEFNDQIGPADLSLGGIFTDGSYDADLAIDSVDIIEPHRLSFTLSGTLNISEEQWHQFWGQWHQDPEGTITLSPSGYTGDAPLTARIWVSPPPDPLRAHPDHIFVPVYDGENDVSIDETFELELGDGEFDSQVGPEDLSLGGIFTDGSYDADLAIGSVDIIEPYRLSFTLSGTLNISQEQWYELWNQWHQDPEGTITLLASGHSGDEDLTARVRVSPPPDPLRANPDRIFVPVYDGENDVFIDETFELELGDGEFDSQVGPEDLSLGGIFADGEGYDADLEIGSVNIIDPYRLSFTLSGKLNISEEQWHELWDQLHQDPEGTITLLASGHSGDEDLTASVWVSPPPDPLRAFDDHIWVDVYDGENDVFFNRTFELELGYSEFDDLQLTDILLGGVFEGLDVKEIIPDHDPSRVRVVIEGNLNISQDEWLDHWGSGGKKYKVATVTVVADGHTGEGDLLAEIRVFSQDLDRPAFSVNPVENRIWGHNWLPNETLDIRIGPENEPQYQETLNTDDWGFFHLDDEGLDIEVGDIVTITGTKITKVHVVTALEVDLVDVDNDIISGTAAPGIIVRVDIYAEEGPGSSRMVIADEEGNWVADFSQDVGEEPWDRAHDIEPGDRGSVCQPDEDDDCTCIDWFVPDPFLEVTINHGPIEGRDWPANTEINVIITDEEENEKFKNDYETDNHGNFHIGQWDLEGVEILPGYTITAEGGGCRVEFETSFIEVTDPNVEDDTISGQAGPGEWVEVIVFVDDRPFHEYPRRNVQANQNGDWLADFSVREGEGDELWAEPFDLEEGDDGCAVLRDEDRNATIFNWWIPSPFLEVTINHAQIKGHDWPAYTEINVIITDGEENEIYENVFETGDGGDFELKAGDLEEVEILPGYTITAEGGGCRVEYEISFIEVTDTDVEDDTISGKAGPGEWVEVIVFVGERPFHEFPRRNVQANQNGDWLANFSVSGGEGGEVWAEPFDLEEGNHGIALLIDEKRNMTVFHWEAH